MEQCLFCGSELIEGKCPNQETHFKKMCLNCTFFLSGVCVNEENAEIARNKAMQSIVMPGGYELEMFQIKPVQLKDPTKKCPRYNMNETMIIEELKKL